jgi:hypothetical protein
LQFPDIGAVAFVTMRTLLLGALALVLSGAAAAADEPYAYGMAQRGTFKVVSNVLLSPTGAEMKGVWLDDGRGCLDKRTLRVSIRIDLVSPAGKTTRFTRSRRGAVDNCAEGGPNFGFDLRPKAVGMGCANGRWRPGRYSMTTTTLDVRSGISAQASLYHQRTRRC